MVRGQAGGTTGVDRVGEMAGGRIDGGGEHLRLKVDAHQGGCEVELGRCQQLNTVGAVDAGPDLIHVVEINFIAT